MDILQTNKQEVSLTVLAFYVLNIVSSSVQYLLEALHSNTTEIQFVTVYSAINELLMTQRLNFVCFN